MPSPDERIFEPDLEASTDPIAIFRLWFEAASATEPNDPNAMAIATATPEAHPSVRMVLMKGLDDRGFAFYTNTDSQKGSELLANPHASAVFHWKTQRRQIRITGPTTELPEADADHYFHTRSRASQINAAASHQSQPVPDRATLEAEAKAVAEANPGGIPPSLELARLRASARHHRVLAGWPRPPPRPHRVHPRRLRLDSYSSLPLAKS